jgi:hypothetical protein
MAPNGDWNADTEAVKVASTPLQAFTMTDSVIVIDPNPRGFGVTLPTKSAP